eukprot:7973306-Pyramimonas_sp.AAC.1
MASPPELTSHGLEDASPGVERQTVCTVRSTSTAADLTSLLSSKALDKRIHLLRPRHIPHEHQSTSLQRCIEDVRFLRLQGSRSRLVTKVFFKPLSVAR